VAESKIKRSVNNYMDLYEITNFDVDIYSLVDNRLYWNWYKYNIAGNPTSNAGILSTIKNGNSAQQIV